MHLVFVHLRHVNARNLPTLAVCRVILIVVRCLVKTKTELVLSAPKTTLMGLDVAAVYAITAFVFPSKDLRLHGLNNHRFFVLQVLC